MAEPLVPKAPAPLAKAPARPGFGAGVLAIFSGIGFIAKTPEVWPLALVPVAIGSALFAALSGVAIKLIPPLFTAWLGGTSGLLAAVLGVVATAIAVVVAGFVGFGLAQPLSGPALERLVRRAEAKDGAPAWPPTSFIEDVLRSLGSLLASAAFGVPLLALLFVVGFVFPPAVVVTFPLKLVVLALLVAWDLCDYPLSIRGLPIRTRLAFMRRNIGAMVGFGLGLALLSLLPCLLLLALPAGVAGAARLIVAIERVEAAELGPRRGQEAPAPL
jgi:CysZ protein